MIINRDIVLENQTQNNRTKKVTFMHSLKLKILLVAFIPLIITMLLLSIVNISSLISSNQAVVELYELDMIKDKQQLIKNQIITISGLIDATILKTPDIEAAKKQIVFLLSKIRYLKNKSGYFYAYEQKEGNTYMVLNGKKKRLIGKKIDINKQDVKGFEYRKALIASKNQDKFITYYSRKPKTDRFQKKIAFAQYIPKLNWTIGTGIYIDDIYQQVDQMKKINSEKLRSTIMQIIIMSSLLLIFSSIMIIVIVKKVLVTPLNSFQIGINSFFDYLVDSSKQVKTIDINSADEFGQMTKSVNSSVKVSMKLHDDLASLMRTMDKNVITSESDGNGIITYVSEAFCKISGYTKEQLIGKPQDIVKHPDMPKNIFEDMWDVIQSDQVWSGEIKSIKKNGSVYWVYAVITPKNTKVGGNFGCTAIRYDITDKKAVEDLTANLEVKIEERTADLEIAKKQIEATHKHTRESIEYAALIQGALLPEEQLFSSYFKDSFTSWIPKDTVGGDIYLFNELRSKDECLLMFIDCTGHGVPGAFVTMLVKAVEAQIIAEIMNSPDMDISPAGIMSFFNKALKKLLRQESMDSVSNAGWDGGIIYYNRSTQILKFAGAETPLFYVDTDDSFHTIKGNRYSVGYKKCDIDYQYKETILSVKEGMKFYCTTDGYIDQNGGKRDYPFGKKRFKQIIEENHNQPMLEQQSIFLSEMKKYESMIEKNDRNDDMTVIGFTIDKSTESRLNERIELLKYDGVITQNVIAACIDNIENKITNMSIKSYVSTLVIEICQNMMNYSKTANKGCREIEPAGLISLTKNQDDIYYIQSRNIISAEDKEKVEATLLEIQSLDMEGIKKRYRELRRSGKNAHKKGGGIGFFEIAKLATHIDYEFNIINDEKYYFNFEVITKSKKRV